MSESIGRTTRLAAVNQILRSIGERETATLVDNKRGDVAGSVSALDESSKVVQEEGWYFNRSVMQLSPGEDGRIGIPNAALAVSSVGPYGRAKLVLRGDYLFNMSEQTYQFENPVDAEVILQLPFEELSEPTRQYITARASRVVAQDRVGDQLIVQALGQDEARTRINLENEESEAEDYNIAETRILRGMFREWL